MTSCTRRSDAVDQGSDPLDFDLSPIAGLNFAAKAASVRAARSQRFLSGLRPRADSPRGSCRLTSLMRALGVLIASFRYSGWARSFLTRKAWWGRNRPAGASRRAGSVAVSLRHLLIDCRTG